LLFPLLDHDDFKKSRKAVIVTAIGLLAISKLVEVNGETKVLGIKIVADKDILVASTFAALCYFLYVFIFRTYERFHEGRYNRSVKMIEDIRAADEVRNVEIEKMNTQSNKSTKFVEAHSELEKLLNETTKLLRVMRVIIFVAVDFAPVIIVSWFSFNNSGGWKAFLAVFGN